MDEDTAGGVSPGRRPALDDVDGVDRRRNGE